jgi:hypothetical protein
VEEGIETNTLASLARATAILVGARRSTGREKEEWRWRRGFSELAKAQDVQDGSRLPYSLGCSAERTKINTTTSRLLSGSSSSSWAMSHTKAWQRLASYHGEV